MLFTNKKLWLGICLILGSSLPTINSQAAKVSKSSSYLFVYFTGDQKDGEQIRFALSSDG